jgi:hypothetical protein
MDATSYSHIARTVYSLNSSAVYALSGVASGVIGGFIVTPVEQVKLSLSNR